MAQVQEPLTDGPNLPHAGARRWSPRAGCIGALVILLVPLLMLVVAALLFRHRGAEGDFAARLGRENAPRLFATGALTGGIAGFFGIGGGFLIVPSLMWSARLPILRAVGTSLIAVTAFGLTTAANYYRAGWVDIWLAAALVGGGLLGSRLGSAGATRLAQHRGRLNTVFAAVIVLVAIYVLWRSVTR